MRLYSAQPRFVYDVLCSEGRFLPRPFDALDEWELADAPHARFAYEWLCREMEARGLVRPDPSAYPVWAWQQFDGTARRKPDLRCLRHWTHDERQVMLSLEVPDDEVLLHDYEAWHFPLNHWYLGQQRASDRFERRCKAAGFPLHSDVSLEDPELLTEMEQSWQRIFDIKGIRRMMRSSAATQKVQATFWELRATQVVDAVEFGHGRPRQRLTLPIRTRASGAR